MDDRRDRGFEAVRATRAESRPFRDWGCDVIGMTAMPEARLAREAALPCATVAMVTDDDCRRTDGAAESCALLPCAPSPIDRALTAAAMRDPALVARNAAILARTPGSLR